MKTVVLTMVLVFRCFTAQAWHGLGHMTVAAIAWDRMTPEARTAAVRLLNSAPGNSGLRALRPDSGTDEERDRAQFIHAATWPDDVRGGPFDHPSWHFADLFWEQPAPGARGVLRDDVPIHGEMLNRLGQLERSLGSQSAPKVSESKSADLAWIIHLMGDIAQPLHCSGRMSPDHPNGDQGGNLFCLQHPEHGKCHNNLHSFWDDVLEREFGKHTDPGQIAAQLERSNRPGMFTGLRLQQYKSWARDSQSTAIKDAYPAELHLNSPPSANYQAVVKRDSLKAITLGGYRLGATLNKVFGQR